MVKVAINGFGRIGKQFLMAALEKKVPWTFVVNEMADLDSIVYGLKYDSVHPTVANVSHDGKKIAIKHHIIGETDIKVFSETDPEKLPWKKEGIDLVVDCSGAFTEREKAEKHIVAGAKKVLISAPAKNHDSTIIMGVNHKSLKKEHTIVSCGSCTTNCAAVLLKVLLDEYSIKNAYFITTHAYTATQRLIDSYDKKDPLRGRAAALNIVPTTSGASKSVVEAIPELQGKLDGYALRVPVPDGSITSVLAQVGKIPNAEDVSRLFKKRSNDDLKGILRYNEDSIASSDIIHDPSSAIFDANFTSIVGDLVSIAGWYDNEWGYSNRLVDLARLMIHTIRK